MLRTYDIALWLVRLTVINQCLYCLIAIPYSFLLLLTLPSSAKTLNACSHTIEYSLLDLVFLGAVWVWSPGIAELLTDIRPLKNPLISRSQELVPVGTACFGLWLIMSAIGEVISIGVTMVAYLCSSPTLRAAMLESLPTRSLYWVVLYLEAIAKLALGLAFVLAARVLAQKRSVSLGSEPGTE